MGAGVIQSESGGSRRRRRGRKRPMSEINVTPFVDVMLVLLIIFMVAAPLLTVGVEVDMPDTAAQPLPNEQEEPLAVTMTADELYAQASSMIKTSRDMADLLMREGIIAMPPEG